MCPYAPALPPTNIYTRNELFNIVHTQKNPGYIPNVFFSLQLGRLSDCPNLVLVAVLLQHALRVILPESFGSVLARESLQDTVAAGMFG